MGEMGDRIERAERYVLGQMDEQERERAERDLEIDPAFRAAMVEIAERMHLFDRKPAASQPAGQFDGEAPGDQWRLLKEKIAAMPQMRLADAETPGGQGGETPDKPAAFGKRRTDRLHAAIVPDNPPKTVGMGLHSVPGRKALLLALCLIAAFALGYAAGVSSTGLPTLP